MHKPNAGLCYKRALTADSYCRPPLTVYDSWTVKRRFSRTANVCDCECVRGVRAGGCGKTKKDNIAGIFPVSRQDVGGRLTLSVTRERHKSINTKIGQTCIKLKVY